MRWFGKERDVEDPMLEEARGNLPILEEFKGSAGWGLVKGWAVQEANSAIGAWTKGVNQEDQRALAAKVTTLGWLIDLIDNKIGLYQNVMRNAGIDPVEGEDEGTTPFTDPYEPVESLED